MFTGIIEEIGVVKRIEKEEGNLHFFIEAAMTPELKIDQSVAHNGVCLTVVGIFDDNYQVTAIQETIAKTSLGSWAVGDAVNLERGMLMSQRLDGHIVQGHVDQTAVCTHIEPQEGSTLFTFAYDSKLNNVTIEKGSITVNGISLTVVNSQYNSFSVAIIPYTLAHTNLNQLKVNDTVNLEFDVIGKYVKRLLDLKN
ncbi:riboflavin synthase [uncultured Mesonia sp.]|uniref:riboflavin synthase n=1 Tax=uncultured Mesonia sp. TaxID=399731 RepID=UPI00374F8C5D